MVTFIDSFMINRLIARIEYTIQFFDFFVLSITRDIRISVHYEFASFLCPNARKNNQN